MVDLAGVDQGGKKLGGGNRKEEMHICDLVRWMPSDRFFEKPAVPFRESEVFLVRQTMAKS